MKRGFSTAPESKRLLFHLFIECIYSYLLTVFAEKMYKLRGLKMPSTDPSKSHIMKIRFGRKQLEKIVKQASLAKPSALQAVQKTPQTPVEPLKHPDYVEIDDVLRISDPTEFTFHQGSLLKHADIKRIKKLAPDADESESASINEAHVQVGGKLETESTEPSASVDGVPAEVSAGVAQEMEPEKTSEQKSIESIGSVLGSENFPKDGSTESSVDEQTAGDVRPPKNIEESAPASIQETGETANQEEVAVAAGGMAESVQGQEASEKSSDSESKSEPIAETSAVAQPIVGDTQATSSEVAPTQPSQNSASSTEALTSGGDDDLVVASVQEIQPFSSDRDHAKNAEPTVGDAEKLPEKIADGTESTADEPLVGNAQGALTQETGQAAGQESGSQDAVEPMIGGAQDSKAEQSPLDTAAIVEDVDDNSPKSVDAAEMSRKFADGDESSSKSVAEIEMSPESGDSNADAVVPQKLAVSQNIQGIEDATKPQADGVSGDSNAEFSAEGETKAAATFVGDVQEIPHQQEQVENNEKLNESSVEPMVGSVREEQAMEAQINDESKDDSLAATAKEVELGSVQDEQTAQLAQPMSEAELDESVRESDEKKAPSESELGNVQSIVTEAPMTAEAAAQNTESSTTENAKPTEATVGSISNAHRDANEKSAVTSDAETSAPKSSENDATTSAPTATAEPMAGDAQRIQVAESHSDESQVNPLSDTREPVVGSVQESKSEETVTVPTKNVSNEPAPVTGSADQNGESAAEKTASESEQSERAEESTSVALADSTANAEPTVGDARGMSNQKELEEIEKEAKEIDREIEASEKAREEFEKQSEVTAKEIEASEKEVHESEMNVEKADRDVKESERELKEIEEEVEASEKELEKAERELEDSEKEIGMGVANSTNGAKDQQKETITAFLVPEPVIGSSHGEPIQSSTAIPVADNVEQTTATLSTTENADTKSTTEGAIKTLSEVKVKPAESQDSSTVKPATVVPTTTVKLQAKPAIEKAAETKTEAPLHGLHPLIKRIMLGSPHPTATNSPKPLQHFFEQLQRRSPLLASLFRPLGQPQPTTSKPLAQHRRKKNVKRGIADAFSLTPRPFDSFDLSPSEPTRPRQKNLLERYHAMDSGEKAHHLSKTLDKALHGLAILGHVDGYLTQRVKSCFKKAHQLFESSEEKPAKRR